MSFHDMLRKQLDDARDSGGESPPEPPSFDPSDHSVDEVVEYVEANPDQRAIVQAIEADGKGRKSIADLGD